MTKPTKWPLRPAKTQIAQSDQSLLSAWRNTGSSATHWAHCEDSNQTGWMPRLIWVFTGHTDHFVGFVMRWLKWYFGNKKQLEGGVMPGRAKVKVKIKNHSNSISVYYIAINIKWLKICDKCQGTSVPISNLLDIGTLTRMLSHVSVAWLCFRWRWTPMTSREKWSYACAESDVYTTLKKLILKVTNYCKWHKIFIAI